MTARRSPRHYQISCSTTMGSRFPGVLRAAQMVEGLQQESQYFPSSCRAHGISTTMRFLLKQIPTCLWTTPRSLLVGGATPVAHGGDGFADECLWVSGNSPARQGGTQKDPGDPRHSRALIHGHSPTAPEQSGQNQVLVTGSIASPRPGEGADQGPSRGCRQEQQEVGPEASGMQGCYVGPRSPSTRQATYDTGPKHVSPDLFGQHFPAGQSIVPRASGATREGHSAL